MQINSQSGRAPQCSRCNDSGFSFKSASCHIGLGVLVNHDLQVSLLIFKWLQVQALGEPQGDIWGFVPKPVHYPDCGIYGVAAR